MAKFGRLYAYLYTSGARSIRYRIYSVSDRSRIRMRTSIDIRVNTRIEIRATCHAASDLVRGAQSGSDSTLRTENVLFQRTNASRRPVYRHREPTFASPPAAITRPVHRQKLISKPGPRRASRFKIARLPCGARRITDQMRHRQQQRQPLQ